MDALRRYLWIWVIAGIIFSSLIIVLVFILINKCISRKAKHKISHLHKGSDFSVVSNKYQVRHIDDDTPPLPPRTQFLMAEAKSYENLAEASDFVQNTPSPAQVTHNCEQQTNDYEEETHNYEDAHDYEQEVHDYEQETHDYEEAHDYEQDLHNNEQSQPDYIEVEEEPMPPPPPPPDMCPEEAEDNVSTEDYDDIAGEDEIHSEEDYDDVG